MPGHNASFAIFVSRIDFTTTGQYVEGMAALDPAALRQIMDANGFSSSDLARECDITEDYVRRLRAGSRRLKRNPVMRRRIADACGVPVHWIETRDETARAS